MAQTRVFHACQGVLIIKKNDNNNGSDISSASFLGGVQSVGVDASFPSEIRRDYGRFQQKFRSASIKQKELSITIDRIIGPGGTFYTTASYGSDYNTNHILYEDNIGVQGELNNNNKSLRKYDIVIVYGPDDQDFLHTPADLSNVVYRDCLITNISYNISVNGYCRESITLVSRNADYDVSGEYSLPSSETGEILLRQDINFSETVLPSDVEDMFKDGDGDIRALQSISIEATIDYIELDDVGSLRGADVDGEQNLWKFVSTPISVTCSFTGISRNLYPQTIEIESGAGSYNTSLIVAGSSPNYTIWDLGKKNYLENFSVSGGDADGGNVELTLSYRNDYSDLVIAGGNTVHHITQTGTL